MLYLPLQNQASELAQILGNLNPEGVVLTVAVMKNTIFWDTTPCSLLSVNRCFGETHRFHLEGRRIS
jgi:hypothetical protein